MSIEVISLTCKTCGDTIISRAHHDCNFCSCDPMGVMIDGCSIADDDGYIRMGGNPENMIRNIIRMDITKQELYNDWNHRIDKYKKLNLSDYQIVEDKQ